MTAGTSSGDLDQRFIAQALPAFISEAREQIETIEQLMLQLENDPSNRELLDALFRCAHTVKGSAGMFGLDDLVAFTHHMETLLDRMREGSIALDPPLSTLLLQCNDQILYLVDSAQHPAPDSGDHAAARADLAMRLQAAMGAQSKAQTDSAPSTGTHPTTVPTAPLRALMVSARFGSDCFRNGMDPLAIVRYLGTLGTVAAISCDASTIPLLDALDAESCHLSIELSLETAAPRQAIEDAFSFVKDDCELRLVEPHAPLEHFAALLDAMPDRPLLGEILVKIGAVTQQQLDAGLRTQRHSSVASGAAAPRLGDVLQRQTGLAADVVDAAVQKQGKATAAPAVEDNRFIRVQADRLDTVINLLGELVTAGAGAALLARQTQQSSLIEANLHMGRLIEEIRNGTLQLRMVPVGETFSRFRRVVRDTATALGKQVALHIVGGDSEMDKSVVERIADPLMHLVRNALDHGLEPPEERLAAGKPAQGTLTLSARHESGSILIRIEDDGRGINREKVLSRAWERGLVPKDAVPPDAEILKLIFAPGFSTADTVTNLSGRGVGMDVVMQNIGALRGAVTLHSVSGAGTTIDIRLPLTLAIIDGFLVAVGDSKFIMPLQAVVEVIESSPAQGVTGTSGRRCVELRGEVLPVVDLRTLYGLESDEPARTSVVVVHGGRTRFGVEVDVLLGQHQTVIKPLGRIFRTLRGIAGSSILGNGEVALIFDMPSLSELAAAEIALPASTVNRHPSFSPPKSPNERIEGMTS